MMLGYEPASFWDQTVRTLDLAVQAMNTRARLEHNRRAWAVWHIAALSRAKKLPSLKRLMMKEPPREQTWQQQAAMFEAFAAAHNARLKRIESKGLSNG